MRRLAFGTATENFTVVAGDETAWLVVEAALIAVTMQVPTLETVSDLPDTVQPVAVPFVTLKVTAPVPEPPLVRRVSVLPMVPAREVTLRALWALRLSMALLVAVVRFREVSVTVRVHVAGELMTRAENVATPATDVAVAVPPRMQEEVIVSESLAPLPVVTTLPNVSSTET
jgi:hypothetical protein